MTLMCENKVFEVLPVKKRSQSGCKRTLHNRDQKAYAVGSIEQPEKKKGFFKK